MLCQSHRSGQARQQAITRMLACLHEELLAVARVAGGSCSSSVGEPVTRSEISVAC
jgi:hypothetical protein